MLIGKHLTITRAKNPALRVEGVVIDESKNTLLIDTSQGKKTIIKDQIKEMHYGGTEH